MCSPPFKAGTSGGNIAAGRNDAQVLARELLEEYAGLPVLVTGARGFLGRPLCRALVKAGARVLALHRTRPELGSDIQGTQSLYADITCPDELQKALGMLRPRVVFHLAACTNRELSRQAVHQTFSVNAVGTHNLLQVLHDHPPQVLLLASPADVYGHEFPPFREECQARPQSAYGSSKTTAWTWARASHIPTIEARLFAVYGPCQPRSLVSELFEAAAQQSLLPMTEGEETRDFTWLEDVVEAFLFLGRQRHLAGESLNLCTGRETSIRQVIHLLGNIVGAPLPIELGALPYSRREVFRIFGDPGKLARCGYRCETALEVGLARCYKAQQESRASR